MRRLVLALGPDATCSGFVSNHLFDSKEPVLVNIMNSNLHQLSFSRHLSRNFPLSAQISVSFLNLAVGLFVHVCQ